MLMSFVISSIQNLSLFSCECYAATIVYHAAKCLFAFAPSGGLLILLSMLSL